MSDCGCGKAMQVAATARVCRCCRSSRSCGCASMSRLHEHILPSVEIEIRLCEFCVPTTLRQYTGCCTRGNRPATKEIKDVRLVAATNSPS